MNVRQYRLKGYFFAAMTAVLFTINGIVVRHIYKENPSLNPESSLFWGFLGALIFFIPYFMVSSGARKRLTLSLKRDGKVIFIISLLTTAGAGLWIFALKYSVAGGVSLLAKTVIVHSAILGIIFLKEKFTLQELIGFVVVIPGVLLIATLNTQVAPKAAVAVLTSAVIYAIQSLVVKKYAPQLHGVEFTYLRACMMFVIFGSILLGLGRIQVVEFPVFFSLGLASVSGLMVGRAFYFESHKYLEISKLNMTMLIEPVIMLVAAYFILGEPLDREKIYGGLLILAGLWMIIRKNIFNGRN